MLDHFLNLLVLHLIATIIHTRLPLAGAHLTTVRKSISSCQLARELQLSQKTAWFLLSRIREAWETCGSMLTGTIEVDEAYFGGKKSNRHANKKLKVGRGVAGKAVCYSHERT